MRVITPQITWHNRDPVLCLDFDPTGPKFTTEAPHQEYYRMATGGADSHLLIWHLKEPNTMKPDLLCVAELTRHNKSVNTVRFSPSGSHIASADDDAYIHIWKNDKSKSEEAWQVEKSLRRHLEDVADLSWSLDGLNLVSASVDNSAVVWDVKKGMPLHIWSDHAGFVQGVSFDPLGEYVATISTDRTLRMYSPKSGKVVLKAIKYPEQWLVKEEENKAPPRPSNEKSGTAEIETKTSTKNFSAAPTNRLFQDDSLKTYCRRLTFSPKGEFLIVPGGELPPSQRKDKVQAKTVTPTPKPLTPMSKRGKGKRSMMEKEKPESNNQAAIIFCRNSFTNPCAVIPTGTSFSIGARFSPVYYKRNRELITYDADLVNPTQKNDRMIACVGKMRKVRSDSEKILLKMPYRLVYAVVTNNSVIIGDTESSRPLAVVKNIHLTRLTDLSWSPDGKVLIVSSTDGYCSIVTFAENELGIPSEEITEVSPNAFLTPLPPVKVKKEPKKKVATKKETKPKEPKLKGKQGDVKKKVEKVKNEESSKTAEEKPEDSTESASTESRKSIKTEKPKAQKPRAIVTPQRNTLDKWIIKTPKSAETALKPPESLTPKTTTPLKDSLTGVCSKGLDSKKPVDQPLSIAANLLSSSTANPMISPDLIRKLEQAPIIVDLDSDSEPEAIALAKLPATLPQSKTSDKVAKAKASNVKDLKELKIEIKRIPEPKPKDSPEKVVTGEKRPATSPLTSQQNPKQPRRIQLITLSATPFTSTESKKEDNSDDKNM